ncbi:DUF2634 domain-containing protein [Paenibacillus sambharensis]|uniref:DUF2634 domain-containing protein n=1 Tax=Paenibacillus sambharensis TaxID=1803190 RepID=A0A2W1LND8_9BACL|nr:DUF2634 domain-containing protein [Paenibacillus sambharensis]PZD96405.1 DUF2634 domain-containing protein [Paenibacillus sambharensis]
MVSLKLQDGDLVMNNGELAIIDEQADVAQSLRIILGTRRGEWFLNPDFGIDSSILHQKSWAAEDVEEVIRAGLYQDERIVSVEAIDQSIGRASRQLTISFTALMTNGEQVRSEVEVSAG